MRDKVECVMLACDNCKQPFEECHSGFTIFIDESHAQESADNEGWNCHNEGDKDYCPLCHKTNDNDELIIDITRFKP